MKLVVIGLTLSSSWGNGHATTYRALLKAFAARGHDVLFLEREAPWYAGERRDLAEPGWCRLAFYDSLQALERWRGEVAAADAVVVGSYTPQGVEVARFVQAAAGGVRAFYDIDTPVTLAKLEAGDEEYLSREVIPGFDVYFSFTGGPTLRRLEARFGSPCARELYCTVDPDAYRPLDLPARWDLSYLGTYSPDRQPTLDRLLLEPARRAPHRRFVVAGPQYPADIAWPANVERIDHLPPAEHAAFYSQSRFTLNVTRADMIAAGWSPSVRLFEAAACATPILSDVWEGLDALLEPEREILLARTSQDVLDALEGLSDAGRRAVGLAGRARILSEHTAAHRAQELERGLEDAAERVRAAAGRLTGNSGRRGAVDRASVRSSAMSDPRPLAVVTGASSGIGLELAKQFAGHGFDVILAADRDLGLAGETVHSEGGSVVRSVEADLATEGGVAALYEAIRAERRPVAALAANAGVGLGHGFLDQELTDALKVVDTNIVGTLALIHAVGRDMRERGEGRILITSSIASLMPGAFQAVYNGTKAFLQSFAFALRNELKDTGVSVTALLPGPTDTDFFERGDLEDTKVGAPDAKKDDPAMVARVGFEALMKGEGDVVAGLKNKLQAAATRVLSDSQLAELHRGMAEPGSASH